jgi:hypothetical protein
MQWSLDVFGFAWGSGEVVDSWKAGARNSK